MFAIFGLGLAEVIILMVIAIIIGAVVMVASTLASSRRTPSSAIRHDEIAELRLDNVALSAENDRLRDELGRLKRGSEKKDPPDGIVAGPTS